MAIALNSVISFRSPLPGKYQLQARSCSGKSTRVNFFAFPLATCGSTLHVKDKRWGFFLPVADSNQVSTDTSNDDSQKDVNLLADDLSLAETSLPQTAKSSKGSSVSSQNDTTSSPGLKSKMKRSTLTAREKLRAARVLSRYTEAKASKSEIGRRVIDVLREGERGKKRSGLPEAPTNLFDDRDRGVPNRGLAFEFPGGIDVFLIVVSAVLISSVMFGTTYIVWKAGAIHFNEY